MQIYTSTVLLLFDFLKPFQPPKDLFRNDVNTDMTSVRTDISNNKSQIDYLQNKLDNKIQLITNEEDANTDGVMYFLVDEIPPAPPSPDPTDPEQPSKPTEPTEPSEPTENPSDPKDSGNSENQ